MCLEQTDIGLVGVKLDRVTVVGDLQMVAAEIMHLMDEMPDWQLQPDYKADAPWYKLTRKTGGVYETVAVLMRNKFQNTWRLDTSNHLHNKQELRDMQRIIALMHHSHLTRIDIAYDFINCKYPGMKHVLVKPGITSTDYQKVTFYGKSGSSETKYLGKRRSLSMIRYYDKLVEQLRARKTIPNDYKNWERLEVQLRGKRSNDWIDQAKKALSYFKLPELAGLPTDQQVNLIILTEHPDVFAGFGYERKAKTRKLYRENQGMNTEYAQAALQVFEKNLDIIQNEVDNFLVKLKAEQK